MQNEGRGDTKTNNELRGSLCRKRITISMQYAGKWMPLLSRRKMNLVITWQKALM